MSLGIIHEIFSDLPDCKEWNAHLLKFKHSKKQGTIYNCRKIEFEPLNRIDALVDGISGSDSESDPLEMKAQAYILCGQIEKNDEVHQVKLISMNTPVSTWKNRFLHNAGKFHDISDKVLNLRVTMNVVIYDRTIYFLDMAEEVKRVTLNNEFWLDK